MRPEPITCMAHGTQVIPLVGEAYALASGSAFIIAGASPVETLRATHAQLTAQADEIDRLKSDVEHWRMKLESARSGTGTAQTLAFDAIAERDKLRAENAELRRRICETCNGHGVIGGPSFSDPGEGGAPCPDCAARAELRKGAERYRFLEDKFTALSVDMGSKHHWGWRHHVRLVGPSIGEAIDAAIAAKEST